MTWTAEKPIVSLKNVRKSFGTLEVLKGVSIDVMKGEVICIIGPSGSGKTSLLAILAGLDLPSKGQVWLEDQEITALDEDTRAQIRGEKVGFVFQSFHLLSRLSAVENVMLPLEIKGDRQAKQKALKALTRVGLKKRASHLPNQLSGGEKQRVAIARAFVTRPTILFADEPTGNLDKASTQSVGKLLFSINQESDTTLILVTHDPVLAGRCEVTYQLDEGRIQ